jgi:hypothetical protein
LSQSTWHNISEDLDESESCLYFMECLFLQFQVTGI